MITAIEELAPCGVFCGACPSIGKTCRGCSSEDRQQGRGSKWGCKVRNCCYNVEKVSFCGECGKFPCKIIGKKLLDTHPGEPAFKYRHEVPDNLARMKELGLDEYLEHERQRWSCPHCGGQVVFYHYKCRSCGKAVNVE
jgi:hypothetical protein